MATLYISEYTATIAYGGRGGSAAHAPVVTEQTIAIGGASAQSSPFNNSTNLVRVHTDSICSILIGANPTATAASGRLAANQTEYFGVPPGFKIAVIANT